jgi:hypothetical protein
MHTTLLLEILKGRQILGKSTCRGYDNIRMDLQGMAWEGVDWMHLSQDRGQWLALVNPVTNLRVP